MKKRRPTGTTAYAFDLKKVSPDELYLDPTNPRLAGLRLGLDDQEKVLAVLWKERAVNEVVDSIAANGYWQHEVLFAARESGKLVVIEGNRRLAAVKLLRSADLCKKIGAAGVPVLPVAEQKAKGLDELPVYECPRERIWDFVGFKHVNGPQDWDSIAKAQYVARVHNEFRIALSEIASKIGDRHDTVKRLYRGLMVVDQAESEGAFTRDDCWAKRFAFSHLWTGLGYAGIQRFLGLSADKGFSPNPVPKGHVSQLGELCTWLYGSRKQQKRPVVQSQNPDLRYLDEVLQSGKGVAALRLGMPLDVCLKLSRGDERLLREALVAAEQALKEARGYMPTGYTGDKEMLQTAKAVQKLATSITEEMETWHETNGQTAQKKRGS
jgi:hypothetical protein